jgi:hypothetical protein
MATRCTCGQGHETFGACVRAKGLHVAWCKSHLGLDATAERNKNRELDMYASARRQGIQPAGTQTHQTIAALEASDRTGRAYDAETGPRHE